MRIKYNTKTISPRITKEHHNSIKFQWLNRSSCHLYKVCSLMFTCDQVRDRWLLSSFTIFTQVTPGDLTHSLFTGKQVCWFPCIVWHAPTICLMRFFYELNSSIKYQVIYPKKNTCTCKKDESRGRLEAMMALQHHLMNPCVSTALIQSSGVTRVHRKSRDMHFHGQAIGIMLGTRGHFVVFCQTKMVGK